MTNLRDMVLKKGGHAKTPTTLRSDLKKMVGTYTHESMDKEPSYKKLHARSHQIRVGEPRKLRKSEVEKEAPYRDRVLHDNREHSSHNTPRMGMHDNRIGLKKGGRSCHEEGGETKAKRGGSLQGHKYSERELLVKPSHRAKLLEGYNYSRKELDVKPTKRDKYLEGYRAEGGETKAKRGGRLHHEEGGETKAKRGGRQHYFLGGLIDKIADYNPLVALASGRGLGGAAQSFGNAAQTVLPFLKKGGKAHYRSEGGELEERKRGGYLRRHHAEGEEVEARKRGGHLRRHHAEGEEVAVKRGGKIHHRDFGGLLDDVTGGLLKRGGRARHAEGEEVEAKKRGGHLRRHHAMGDEVRCGGGRMSEGGETEKAKKGMWIQDAINPSHKGKLHRELHVPMGEKIPSKKLMRAEHSRNPTIRKEANLAKTLRSFHPKGRS